MLLAGPSFCNRECTVLGAAILGAVGCGHFTDIDEAVTAMVAIDHTIDPDRRTTNVYQDLFQVFRQAYEAQAQLGVYQAIYQFQQRYFLSLHGWPGSVVEFQKVIEPLTLRTAATRPTPSTLFARHKACAPQRWQVTVLAHARQLRTRGRPRIRTV